MDRLRATLGGLRPPIVALTSLRRGESQQPAGVSASVTKPIKASRLFDAISEVLVHETRTAYVAPRPETGPLLAERHPLRILVAEDNVVNQKVAVSLMARLGYRADLVSNGVEAVDAVRRLPYDVVFMDLQMPELDGLGAMQQIHESLPADRRPRIVALTANAFEEDRAQCLAAGMDDYLSKPLRTDKLEAALLRSQRLGAIPPPASVPSHSG